ncbi:N-acetylmuramoyl-L-alanine amidase [Shewanella waksmanii]|uniref:N-acetylmuramoyl-L-alanine amidase n=1 Tax=Shewanella waksmanii TaxID=213783 RepID=UPI0004B39188|nr:N-acetylmuramoyl-L-alanine amidase [Shewanella waksmanii]
MRRLNSLVILCVVLVLSTACGSFVELETPNQNDRVKLIIIHYTAIQEDETLARFMDAEAEVSSHFLVSKKNIYRLADESKRTFHAGYSSWNGRSFLNDTSIGIELVQKIQCGNDDFDSVCMFKDYDPKLIINLEKVLAHVYERYPNIEAINVVGHQDIATSRKLDPGPRFPWQYLYSKGYGAWYDEQDFFNEYRSIKNIGFDESDLFQVIVRYGYSETDDMETVIRAFQAHFTPTHIAGKACPYTMAVAMALLKKYKQSDYEAAWASLKPKVTGQVKGHDSKNSLEPG